MQSEGRGVNFSLLPGTLVARQLRSQIWKPIFLIKCKLFDKPILILYSNGVKNWVPFYTNRAQGDILIYAHSVGVSDSWDALAGMLVIHNLPSMDD